MIAVTVRPMRIGTISLDGRPTLHPSVSIKIVMTSKEVPRVSTRKARGRETEIKSAGTPGFGKYSPNIIAVVTEASAPRVILWTSSKLDGLVKTLQHARL